MSSAHTGAHGEAIIRPKSGAGFTVAGGCSAGLTTCMGQQLGHLVPFAVLSSEVTGEVRRGENSAYGDPIVNWVARHSQ